MALFAATKQIGDVSVLPAPAFACGRGVLGMGGGDRCSVLVTGGNSGIGFALVSTLAEQGHTVFMGCRSQDKCDKARRSLPEPLRTRVVPVGGFELRSLSSVAEWTAQLADHGVRSYRHGALDMVIMNAGFTPKGNGTTADGFEAGLGAMHFGHFGLLKWLVRDALVKDDAVVTLVSSDAARLGAFDPSLLVRQDGHGDLHGEVTHGCEPMGVLCVHRSALTGAFNFGSYARAKLANVLMAREMAARHPAMRSVSVHPGMVMTPLAASQASDLYGDDTGCGSNGFGLDVVSRARCSALGRAVVRAINAGSELYMQAALRPAASSAAVVLRAAKRTVAPRAAAALAMVGRRLHRPSPLAPHPASLALTPRHLPRAPHPLAPSPPPARFGSRALSRSRDPRCPRPCRRDRRR